jgi:hypothetical protein
MKQKIIILVLCLFIINSTQAQQTKKKKYNFHSINSLVLVNGDNGVSAALQTVNGFSKGPLFAGIGLGLDYYQYRSVPLFADIRYELSKKKNKFFAYADAGINFHWVKEFFNDWPSPWETNRNNNFNNGVYIDGGIGANVGLKNGHALVLSLGYSHKTLEETITFTDWRTGELQKTINNYRFNRIMIKTGFRF